MFGVKNWVWEGKQVSPVHMYELHMRQNRCHLDWNKALYKKSFKWLLESSPQRRVLWEVYLSPGTTCLRLSWPKLRNNFKIDDPERRRHEKSFTRVGHAWALFAAARSTGFLYQAWNIWSPKPVASWAGRRLEVGYAESLLLEKSPIKSNNQDWLFKRHPPLVAIFSKEDSKKNIPRVGSVHHQAVIRLSSRSEVIDCKLQTRYLWDYPSSNAPSVSFCFHPPTLHEDNSTKNGPW